MGITDRERLDLYNKLEATLGAETADALIDYRLLAWREYAVADRAVTARALPPGSDLDVAVATVRTEVRAAASELSAEIKAAAGELRSEVRAMTSERETAGRPV